VIDHRGDSEKNINIKKNSTPLYIYMINGKVEITLKDTRHYSWYQNMVMIR